MMGKLTVILLLAGIAMPASYAGSLALHNPNHPLKHQEESPRLEGDDHSSAEDLAARGELLVQRYCVACHTIPLPVIHSASLWPSIIERMKQHMREAGKPVPSAEETAAIIEYMQSSARH